MRKWKPMVMGTKQGEINMDLWELPPIDPSKTSSTMILLVVTLGSSSQTNFEHLREYQIKPQPDPDN